jgi:formylglycine-generating enzyme required for sulfatase activity
MVRVPARQFTYGGVGVDAASFLLDVHPVTNAKYAAFVAAEGALAPAWWSGSTPPTDRLDHPVTGVNLAAARAYARWAGKRLPTAEEWLSAAHAVRGGRFPWGDACSAATCQCAGTGAKGTSEVGAHPAGTTPDGVADLYGNTWEWTERGALLRPEHDGTSFAFGASYRHGCSAPAGLVPRAEVSVVSEYPYLGFRCAADVGGEA